jgi:hypothetical protein
LHEKSSSNSYESPKGNVPEIPFRQLEIISKEDLFVWRVWREVGTGFRDFFRSLFSPDINPAKSFGFHRLREKLIYREGYGL